jgi:hypothetical protein
MYNIAVNNIVIFLSERRHNVTFHPLGIFGHHWSLFTLLFTFLLFTWKVAGDLKFELKFGIEFWFKLKGFKKCFLRKCLGSPSYLMVVSGGSLSLGVSNRDTRRCFLWCLQVSSSSSLLFNIEFWSAVRITSFSVRHRSHVRPPLENG